MFMIDNIIPVSIALLSTAIWADENGLVFGRNRLVRQVKPEISNNVVF